MIMKTHEDRRYHRLMIIISAVIAVVIGSVAVYAATTAGTDSDPVVTKSYVDNAIAGIKSGGNTPDNTGSDSEDGFQIIELKAGQQLTGYQDTQLVVRSGSVRAVIPGENGLSDLTDGSDITVNNVSVRANHLILVPRSDGRGIKARTDSFVMVKGAYTIGS